ncbi:MAG: 50S ribosomal protein L11 methyltransferase [Clostridia bacterium]|nr:50S ribosomal protein L11 methyltransferase [Clostridia bacterium]
MKQREVSVSTNSEGSELLADILMEMSVHGVIIYDSADLYRNKTWDYIDESATAVYGRDGEVTVKGYIAVRDSASLDRIERRIEKLKDFCEREGVDYGTLKIETKLVDDDKWRDVWKKSFKPVKHGNVVICPEWENYIPRDDEYVVRIDPGLAFGTGEHETTDMILTLMQSFDYDGKEVVDIGCGSGILGITARVLGANSVTFIDNDEQAVEATSKNLSLNAIAIDDGVEVQKANLTDNAMRKYDIAFANLTADILLLLVEGVKDCLKEQAVILMSGIINSKIEQVLTAYKMAGFVLIESQNKGEWNAIIMRLEPKM